MSKQPVARWILVVSFLIALLGLFVGGSLYVSPQTFIPNADFSSAGAHFLAQMWGARQVAIAGMLGFGVLRRSRAVIQTVLTLYAVMNVQDAAIGIAQADSGLALGAAFFGSLAAWMAWRLRV